MIQKTIMKNYQRLIFLLLVMSFRILYIAYTQEEDTDTTKYPQAEQNLSDEADTNKEEEKLLEKYSATLLYGIDSSVLETIKSITELKIPDFEERILERMQETSNDEIITRGFGYLNTMEYPDATTFALTILEQYQNYANRTVQYATFYLKDYSETLSKEDIEILNNSILEIIDSEIPAIAIAAAELISAYYTEKDQAIINLENSLEANTESIDSSDQDMGTANVQTIDELFSTKLKNRYDTTSIPVLRDQILLTLGEIQAINQLDFIVSIAENTNASVSLRGRAIQALANFESLSPELEARLASVLENTKQNEIPAMRLATMQALTVALKRTENSSYLDWLYEGLRDNDIGVRKEVLKSYSDIFTSDISLSNESNVFSALQYMVEEDPEATVRSVALKTLAAYPKKEAKEYVLSKLTKITRLNSIDKAIIEASLESAIAKEGGIATLVDLVKIHQEKKESSIIEYIATSMVKSDAANISPLVEILLQYKSSSVRLSCISTIAKYKLKEFIPRLEILSEDITQAKSVRKKAEETLSLLTE